MKAPPFAYVRAASLADVFRLWGAAGPEAKLLAGGQTLLATLAFRLSEPGTLIDISRVPSSTGISQAGERHPGRRADDARRARRQRARAPARAAAGRGGAADRPSRHPQPRHHRRLARLRRSGRRAAGLLRGARCRRSSRAAPRASGASRRRSSSPASMPPRSAANELIAAVEFPVAKPGERTVILELARRSGDYAMAGVVARAEVAGGTLVEPRLVFFGVGDTPVVAERAMAARRRQAADARDDRRRRRPRSMPTSTRPPISTAARR